MSRRPVYAEDFPPEVLERMRSNAFDEQTEFRKRMKALEEHAMSGAVVPEDDAQYVSSSRRGVQEKPRPTIAGQRVRIAHRMGDRYDVQVLDPFTRKMRTVASHQYDLRGNRVSTDTAWAPGDPKSVAAVFNIPFVSAFGDLPENKPQDVKDREEAEKARHDVWQRARVEEETAQAKHRLILKYARMVGTPYEYMIPASYLNDARKAARTQKGTGGPGNSGKGARK